MVEMADGGKKVGDFVRFKQIIGTNNAKKVLFLS